jgi:tetratricopeptide (TPR) repeat protein
MKRLLSLILLCAPLLAQAQDNRVGIRMITVRTEAEAVSLRNQILNGATFEALGGKYLGLLRPTDLRPEVQRVLEGIKPGEISAVTQTGNEFALVQRLTLEEASWIDSHDTGLQAFQLNRYEEAAKSFQQAVQYAEKLTPADYRLEDSLHGLAESYRLQKKYAEAEPFYRRYLTLHWDAPNAWEVLDRFSAMIALAYFPDSDFEESRRKFNEALKRAPIGEDLYQAMSAILFKAQLPTEAETLMVQAAQLFPASKDVHYHLAQLYRSSFKTKKALEVFEMVSRMKGPASIDPALDRLQQSVVYQKIGSIRAELVEFDEAASAYKKALDLTSDSSESRLGLGDVYLQQGRPDDALAEYSRVAASDIKNAAAQFRVADAHLRMGHFREAAAAAAQVLIMDPAHRRAHYVQGTALVRIGQNEAGESELELYRKLEAESRSETTRSRNIVVLNRGAAAKLMEGHPDEAIEMFGKVIETYPDAPAHYLNLGAAQSKLGRHKAAVDTFQKMLSLGMTDSFLLYWNLSHEYQLLGDMEASRRHQVVYLQNLDLALREALEWNLEQ